MQLLISSHNPLKKFIKQLDSILKSIAFRAHVHSSTGHTNINCKTSFEMGISQQDSIIIQITRQVIDEALQTSSHKP